MEGPDVIHPRDWIRCGDELNGPKSKGRDRLPDPAPEKSDVATTRQSCSVAGSTFTPGPMVEETATRWM
jgi:hypothetical protein